MTTWVHRFDAGSGWHRRRALCVTTTRILTVIDSASLPRSTIPSPDASATAAIAPTSVLRAGINVGNALLVNGAGPAGEPTGVSPSIAAALAERLGVPLELVSYSNPGDLADAANADRWDIACIGGDAARAREISFTSPYCEIEGAYLVRGESAIGRLSDVDRPGVRIATRARAAYTLWLERNVVHAELVITDRDAVDVFVDRELEVLAGLRPALLKRQERLPSSRILDEPFTAVQQAIGIPRTRDPAGLAYLERFVDAAVRSGLVAELIERHDVSGLSIPARRSHDRP
jgi:polar amino acid transport system substrate-binding protein